MASEYEGPQIVWDPAKALINERKHGVTFEDAATVFLDPLLLVVPDLAHSQEEERWAALGRASSQLLLVVIHTENINTIRIISARKAEPRERRNYEER
ncbi:BrnT family toxin [Acidicapsa dinghuensis]|uniref:BrnT family toxin n=1 Tax=Acidicapsa dinghuensis TaxID=2218256 RepID=A0ABW1EKF4_9BACT|nr:BrnT family toxin [Acidicapsa dinghuensis]